MSKRQQGKHDGKPTQFQVDHRAKQLNPNNDEYWKSRGHESRPDGWETGTAEPPPPSQDGTPKPQ
jgi:hypothetical protein